MNLRQYLNIIRTFSNEFPHTSIWRIGSAYSLLLATPEPLNIDFQNVSRKLTKKNIRQNLMPVSLDNPFELLSHFALGENKVKEMVAGSSEIITDESPSNLFFAPGARLSEQYQEWPLKNLTAVEMYQESITLYLTNISNTEDQTAKIIDIMKRYEMKRDY